MNIVFLFLLNNEFFITLLINLVLISQFKSENK